MAGTLSLFADPVRAWILYSMDLVEELCVGDVVQVPGATKDAVGYGVTLPRTAGPVGTRKQGRVVFCRLAEDFPALVQCPHQLVRLSRAGTTDTTDSADGADRPGIEEEG